MKQGSRSRGEEAESFESRVGSLQPMGEAGGLRNPASLGW